MLADTGLVMPAAAIASGADQANRVDLAPVAAWVPPLSRDEDGYGVWNVLAGLVPACGVTTTVTSDMPAQVWGARMVEEDALLAKGLQCWPDGRKTPPRAAHLSLMAVETGLALPDLYEVAPSMDAGGIRLPNWAVQGLMTAAVDLYPNCSLRSMVGWLGAGMATNDPTTGGHVLYASWTSAGFDHEAWAYAAAGLTPDETAAGLRAGTLDRHQALAMAALRGVVLPVG